MSTVSGLASRLFATAPIKDTKLIKGIPFPAGVSFRQLLITGPPGSGKTTLLNRLGGWSEEGYVDLTVDKWWAAQSLSLRPREIHLGLPFVGCDKALAVFDQAWLDADPPLELELRRIRLPPKKRHVFAVDWHKRYVFEFLIPTPETVYRWRSERAKTGTHYVDAGVDLGQIVRQVEVFQRVARYLHVKGVSLYVRRGPDAAPEHVIIAPC